MAKTITQREMRNDSGAVLRAVEGGEEFTVTRNGTPVARIVPLKGPDRRFVSREQMAEGLAGMPQIDYKRFRADLEEAFDYDFRDPYERRND